MSKKYHDRLLRGRDANMYARSPIGSSGCGAKGRGKYPRAVLSRHVFYLNFSRYDSRRAAEMAHFNVMRDPVSRCVSRFYYERDARGTFPHDQTLDECMGPNGRCNFETFKVEQGAAMRGFQRFRQFREECASNYLSRWFCGMDKVCHESATEKGGRALLAAAKKTVAEGYIFVGLTAEMKTNFKVLQRLLPNYFANEDIPTDICNKCKKPAAVAATEGAEESHQESKHQPDVPSAHHDPAVAPPPPPPAERPKVNKQNEARIAALNSLDVELYAFVEDLFWAKAEACGALSTEEGEGGNISTTESAPLALVDAHRRHLFRFF